MAQRSDELLKALARERVEFVVVGGVAANLYGSSYATRDLDIVAPLTVENCGRLMAALHSHSPRFYQAHGKPLVVRPPQELAHFKNLYLLTDIGIVDVLGSLPPVGSYETVASRAVPIAIFGVDCRIVSLDDLIDVKHHVGRPKDKAVEVELRAIRERLKAT